MGIIKAFAGALNGTMADQWKDIIQPLPFDEYTLVDAGVYIGKNNNRGSNYKGSVGVISNGSIIYVPENSAAFIFNQEGIEEIITEPGGYQYTKGQDTVFDGEGIKKSIIDQTAERFKHGGITPDSKRVAYINLREIRNIKFGTRGPQVYNDTFYGVDLEVTAFGVFSIKVVDAEKLIKNFLPAGTSYYSFDDINAKEQLLGEFLQSFSVALNRLSDEYRISKIQSHGNDLVSAIVNDTSNVGTWPERFGIKLISIGLNNIEMTEESKELVRKYASRKMDVGVYEDVSKRAADIATQQKIASGIEQHGLGDGGGMILGMNMAQNFSGNSPNPVGGASQETKMSIDEQIEVLKKMKDLVDAGILTQEEFDKKKKEIMGL